MDFQCIKTSLKSVAKNTLVIEKLTKAAILSSRIATHTLLFLKLYLIHCYDNGTERIVLYLLMSPMSPLN